MEEAIYFYFSTSSDFIQFHLRISFINKQSLQSVKP